MHVAPGGNGGNSYLVPIGVIRMGQTAPSLGWAIILSFTSPGRTRWHLRNGPARIYRPKRNGRGPPVVVLTRQPMLGGRSSLPADVTWQIPGKAGSRGKI